MALARDVRQGINIFEENWGADWRSAMPSTPGATRRAELYAPMYEGGQKMQAAVQQMAQQATTSMEPTQQDQLADLADLFYGKAMAQVSSDFGRRGLMSSSMYGQASARAAAESQLMAWDALERQRSLDIQEKQVKLMGQQLAMQKQDMYERWQMQREEMDYMDRWKELDRAVQLRRLAPDTAPKATQIGGSGGQQGLGGAYQPTGAQRRQPTAWEQSMGIVPTGTSGYTRA